MYLTERHIIKNNKELDEVCFNSKNLYNKALYLVRQHYFKTKGYLNYYDVYRLMVDSKDEDYYALPTKVSVQTLKLLDRNFKSFFALFKKKQSGNHDNPIRIPKYLDKEGRYITVFPKDAVSKVYLRKGIVKLSSLSILIPQK